MLNSFKLFKHQLDYVMCDDKYPFMIGGVGSGKTTAFCIFALNQCAKNASFWNATFWNEMHRLGRGRIGTILTCALERKMEGNYFEYEGAPYCETHYHAMRGALCAGCGKPISGRCVTAMFRKFHPEHFVCSFCSKQLNRGTFEEQEEKVPEVDVQKRAKWVRDQIGINALPSNDRKKVNKAIDSITRNRIAVMGSRPGSPYQCSVPSN